MSKQQMVISGRRWGKTAAQKGRLKRLLEGDASLRVVVVGPRQKSEVLRGRR